MLLIEFIQFRAPPVEFERGTDNRIGTFPLHPQVQPQGTFATRANFYPSVNYQPHQIPTNGHGHHHPLVHSQFQLSNPIGSDIRTSIVIENLLLLPHNINL